MACSARLTVPAEVLVDSMPVAAAASREATAAGAAPADPLSDGYRVARMGDRLIASIFDSIFLVIIYAVIGTATAARLGGITDSGFSLTGGPAGVAIGATLFAGFLYFWLVEGIFGATLGKGIIGIQVRKKSGPRCGMKAAFIRNLLRIFDVIGVYLVGFLIAIFSKRRQRLGDHVAGTVVVEREPGKAVRALLVLIWFATITAGLTGAYLIHRS